MLNVHHIFIHVTHACNLKCDNCGHFSDMGFTGNVSIEATKREMEPWSKRLIPKYFDIMGGEPTLNPDLPLYLYLSKELWPNSIIKLITNGWFLGRQGEPLQKALLDCNIRVEVSVHHDSPTYQQKMAEVNEILKKWGVDYDFRYPHKVGSWQKMYRGKGKEIEPYNDGNPRKSWENCISRDCLAIHEGKLYKCPLVTYLPMMDRKYGLSESWSPYLKYKPLDSDCSDAELLEFISRQDESCCGACPINPEKFKKGNPIPGGK